MTIITKFVQAFPPEPEGPNYKLQGTVIGQDGNPKASKVAVFKEESDAAGDRAPPGFRVFRIIKTNTNGEYAVSNVSPQNYTLIAYDKTGEYDPVIKGGLIPEPME